MKVLIILLVLIFAGVSIYISVKMRNRNRKPAIPSDPSPPAPPIVGYSATTNGLSATELKVFVEAAQVFVAKKYRQELAVVGDTKDYSQVRQLLYNRETRVMYMMSTPVTYTGFVSLSWESFKNLFKNLDNEVQ